MWTETARASACLSSARGRVFRLSRETSRCQALGTEQRPTVTVCASGTRGSFARPEAAPSQSLVWPVKGRPAYMSQAPVRRSIRWPARTSKAPLSAPDRSIEVCWWSPVERFARPASEPQRSSSAYPAARSKARASKLRASEPSSGAETSRCRARAPPSGCAVTASASPTTPSSAPPAAAPWRSPASAGRAWTMSASALKPGGGSFPSTARSASTARRTGPVCSTAASALYQEGASKRREPDRSS